MNIKKAIETVISMRHILKGLLPPDEQAVLEMAQDAFTKIDLHRQDPQHIVISTLINETRD